MTDIHDRGRSFTPHRSWAGVAANPTGLELPHAPEWFSDGLCAQTDPDLWFPEKGGSTRAAKAVCHTCPVESKCLEYALARGERFGIWGGMSERERRTLGGAA